MKDISTIDFTDFSFNGVYLSTFGAHVGGREAFKSFSLLPSKETVVEKVIGNDKQKLVSKKFNPRTFTVPIHVEDLSGTKLRDLALFLDVDSPKEFFWKGDSVYINCMPDVEELDFDNLFDKHGVMSIKFIAYDPYFYEIETYPLSSRPVSIVNGGFESGDFTGWEFYELTSKTIVNGIAKFTANSIGAYLWKRMNLIIGHKYYACGYIKANNNNVNFVFGAEQKLHTGSGNFEKLSVIEDYVNTSYTLTGVIDFNSSTWSEVQFDYIQIIDITGDTRSDADIITFYDNFDYIPSSHSIIVNTNTSSFYVNNIGNKPSYPLIQINCNGNNDITFKSFDINVNEITSCVITGVTDNIYIDTLYKRVYSITNGVITNKIANFTGTFPIFNIGNVMMYFESSTFLDIIIHPRFNWI